MNNTTPTITVERASRLVRQYTAVREPEIVATIAQRMVETGECAWHALAQVTGGRCWCADCNPTEAK